MDAIKSGLRRLEYQHKSVFDIITYLIVIIIFYYEKPYGLL